MQSNLRAFCLALGKRVRELRLERRLTQEDMSDHGFVVRHYQRIEAGRSVTLRTIWKLAQAFKVAPRELFPSDSKAVASTRKAEPRRRLAVARARTRRRHV